MRILLLTNKPPFPPRDGSSLATSQIINGPASKNYKIHVFYLNTSRHNSTITAIPSPVKNSKFIPVDINTTIRYLPALLSLFFSRTPYTVSRFINRESKQKLIALLEKQKFDIVQFEGLAMAPYLPLLSRSFKGSVIFRPHNAEFMIWHMLAKTEKNLFKKIYFLLLSRQIKKYEKKTSAKFGALLPISQEDQYIFQQWNPKARMLVLPFGENLSIVKTKTNATFSKTPVLLFLGALDWQPNLQGLTWFLRKAWPVLTKDFPGIRIKIAGRNPDEKFVRFIHKTINQRKSASGIDFLGEIDTTESFYLNGALFVVPLLAGGGIRIKILEAMARKCAVISTSIGAAGIPVTHGKDILIADDAQDFTQSIEKMIKEPELYHKITENALFLLQQHFDPSRIIENLEKFYRKL